jgi:hypothetical protein
MSKNPATAGDGWARTRRNVVAMCGILSTTLLSACRNGELSAFENLLPSDDHHSHHHHRDHDDDSHTVATASDPNDPNCYLKGTRILTTDGPQPIEEIGIGDRLIVNGKHTTKCVEWIGRLRYDRGQDEDWPMKLRPVRIRCGALRDDVPVADLLVSQNHRLYLGGMLIRAGDLVNGTTIDLDPQDNEDTLEYYHLLVDGHHIIYANGAPSETLLFDHESKTLFDNYDEFERLYANVSDQFAMPCAPIYADRGLKSRLNSCLRSAISPLIDLRQPYDIVRDSLTGGGQLPDGL